MQGTHGPLFNPREQTFSIGQVQDKKWMTDFYDDAILDFDRQVGQVFEHLSQAGMLDNTIIIIYSDHGFEWQTRNRIPLIIWFPKGEHAGIIKNNVQNLDIVPTILDYLGIPQPEWLSGRSLLSQGEPPVDRYILAASTTGELVAVTESRGWALSEDKIAPPFYQLGYVSLIVCNRWYELYFIHPRLLYGEVQGHTAPCDANNLPTTDYAKSIILNHLADNDYNVSSFPKDISITPAATTVPTVSATVVTPPTTTAIPPTTIPSPVSITWEYPTTGWNPLIAHGFGQWHGKYSPNNYEAFLESLAEGYRTFEVDILMSSDGIPLAAHDRQEWEYYGLSGVFSDYTAEQFLATKLDGVGTTMAGPQILQLLKDYPDVRIVLDVKVSDQTTAIIWFLDRLPMSQWPRLLTNIRTEQQIQNLYAKYPSYRGAFLAVNAWREDLVFSDEDVKDIVMQYDLAGVFTWVNELDYSLDYLANNAAHRRWSPTLERYMIEAGKAMIWHTTDDPALIALRRSAGGAVITDTATPEPHPLRVLIISIDGFRPEAIFQAPMPNLMALMQTSAYTLSAQTIYPSFTLPSHVTMLTGLCPSQHGVVWNDYFPDRGYAVGIDIFDLADAAGMRTFMVVGKLKLRQITEPESTDIFEFINDRDTVIAARVAKLIPQGFDLMFVHFPTPDLIGHEYGWLSPEQLSVLYRSDEALGTILSALDEAGLREDTLIIITADHGGHNTTHGTNRPDDMTIPWIIFGPGVVPIQLTTAVNTTDTAATAAWALNLPIPLEWDGRPVLEAFGLLDEPHPQPRCP